MGKRKVPSPKIIGVLPDVSIYFSRYLEGLSIYNVLLAFFWTANRFTLESLTMRGSQVVVTPEIFLDVSTLPLRMLVHRTAIWFVPRLQRDSEHSGPPSTSVNDHLILQPQADPDESHAEKWVCPTVQQCNMTSKSLEFSNKLLTI
jgi:hypothetical protein